MDTLTQIIGHSNYTQIQLIDIINDLEDEIKAIKSKHMSKNKQKLVLKIIELEERMKFLEEDNERLSEEL